MNWRKHMVLMVGGGPAVVLLIASLVFLVRFQGSIRQRGELESANHRLQQLEQSQSVSLRGECRIKSQQNLRPVPKDFLGHLHRRMFRQGQIKGEDMEPAEFAPLLEKSSRRLQQKAQESGVVLPSGFAFGFPRYAEGALPNKDDVFRLVAQLRAVEAVCDVLFQASISANWTASSGRSSMKPRRWAMRGPEAIFAANWLGRRTAPWHPRSLTLTLPPANDLLFSGAHHRHRPRP